LWNCATFYGLGQDEARHPSLKIF